MPYNNQNALKLENLVNEAGRPKDTFKKASSDPLLAMEYVSPVNQGRFSTIGRLESGVSLLQSAQLGIEKTKQWLQEIRQFLEENDHGTHSTNVPISVVNRFIEDRLIMIENLVGTSKFQGRKVLDGSYGIKAKTEGKHLKFVRGSARVASSPETGFPVQIYQPPKPAILMGKDKVTQTEVDKEKLIALNDGSQDVRYRIRNDETPDSLVRNLRECLLEHHIDVEIFRTQDDRLFFRHNQLGSKNSFKGMSYKSRLISDIPGQYMSSTPGIDIAGTIGSESAHGDGGFLMGDKGNKYTDGLVVFYNGTVDFPGQVVGEVHTVQNGIAIPLDSAESAMEMLSLPSIDPNTLAVGVTNCSGYENLRSVRVIKDNERFDALKMVIWSIVYLQFLAKELKQKENEYVERTLDMLKGSTAPFVVNDDALFLSKDKAEDMIDQINAMLKK